MTFGGSGLAHKTNVIQ